MDDSAEPQRCAPERGGPHRGGPHRGGGRHPGGPHWGGGPYWGAGPHWIPPWAGRRSPAFALPVLLGFFQVFGTFGAQQNQQHARPLDAVGVLMLLAGPATLLARRRHPVPTLVAVATISEVYLQIGYPWGPFIFSLFAAMLSAVIRGHRSAAWLLVALLYGSDIAITVLRGKGGMSWQTLVAIAAVLSLVLVAGDIARATREAGSSMIRAAAEERRRQASDERLRMARELHDVLAHNISLINVQAGVALHLMDGDPEQARTALTAIKLASKDTLGELRAALGMLRGGDEQAPRSPTPGLDRLPELIDQVRGAGLPVRTEIGELPTLAAPVQLAAFRIVQEALTNVRRHAAAASASVRLAYSAGELTVRVDDDGTGAAPVGHEPGSGIAGMRERATALGGTLTAGPRTGGGFRVEARLPVTESARMAP